MKQLVLISSILLLFISCKKEFDITPKYSDFKNDLEIKNLYKNVKTLQQFRANIDTINTNKTDKPVPVFKEMYTIAGNIKSSTYFDFFGNTQQTTKMVYDSNNNLIQSTTTGKVFPELMVQTITKDSIAKTETVHSTINNSLYSTFISTFNESYNMTQQLRIEQQDTSKVLYSYTSKNKLAKETVTNKSRTIINSYKYNINGSLIESINGSTFFRIKTIYDYDGDTISKITEYNIADDGIEYLMKETTFDRYYNPIHEKHYENNVLSKELNIEYNFDAIGNWIKKTVALKSHTPSSKTFKPIYVETRTITYWN